MLKFFKEYFNLSNNEQRGLLLMLSIILVVFLLPKIILYFKPAAEMPSDNQELLAQFYEEDDVAVNQSISTKKEVAKEPNITYFLFNPNTATKQDLIRLGFNEKIASTLINFRNKGGKFYDKADLKKVYGVDEDLYQQLEPYIDIPEKDWVSESNYKAFDNKDKKIDERSIPEKKPKEKEVVIVNINKADSTALRAIYGIGPTFASRIIKYRDLLGGFTHKEQLLEVYGLKNETYDAIKEQVTIDGKVKQLNINRASWKELVKHPYISAEQASIFTKYIKTHGQINDLSEILNSSIFTEEEINLLSPYLTIE